jgi:hypothetical protein
MLSSLISALWIAQTFSPFALEQRRLYGKDFFPETTPFDDLRWTAHRPEVLVDGRWYELLAIEDLNAGLIMEYAKQTADDDWRKRFSEDLPLVMMGLRSSTLLYAKLSLRDLETGARIEITRRMRSTPRDAIRDGRARSPFEDARIVDDHVEVSVDGSWLRAAEVAGVSATEWLAAAARARIDPESAFTDGFYDVHVDTTGNSPRETVAVVLTDDTETRELALPMSRTNRHAGLRVLRAAFADRERTE